jgi:hypothetical protein
MREAEWLDEFGNPKLMIQQLCRMGKARGKRGQRKMRLFASACCRLIIAEVLADRSREVREFCERVTELFERFAEDEVDAAELSPAQQEVSRRIAGHTRPDRFPLPRPWIQEDEALRATLALSNSEAVTAANRVLEVRPYWYRGCDPAHLLRDIFGNPFRPVSVDSGLLTWEGGVVVRLAQGIYNERAFDDLPILADALEEAGCTDPLVFDHLEETGSHTRGCWVLDLLLARE